jgi:hypothetical protein
MEDGGCQQSGTARSLTMMSWSRRSVTLIFRVRVVGMHEENSWRLVIGEKWGGLLLRRPGAGA